MAGNQIKSEFGKLRRHEACAVINRQEIADEGVVMNRVAADESPVKMASVELVDR